PAERRKQEQVRRRGEEAGDDQRLASRAVRDAAAQVVRDGCSGRAGEEEQPDPARRPVQSLDRVDPDVDPEGREGGAVGEADRDDRRDTPVEPAAEQRPREKPAAIHRRLYWPLASGDGARPRLPFG